MAKNTKESDKQPIDGKPKKTAKKAPKAPQTTHKPIPKSEEIIVDSDVSSESEDANPNSDPGHGLVNGAHQSEVSSAQNGVGKEATRTPAEDDESAGSTSSGADEEIEKQNSTDQISEHASHGERNEHQNHDESQRGVKRKAPDEDSMSRPPPRFQPPKGFESVKVPKLSSIPSMKSLESSNLQGKQIWHIVAPAKVPMSALKDIAFNESLNGKSALNHKGISYRLQQSNETEHKDAKLLVPDERGNGMKAVHGNIARTLHIHQLLQPADTSFTPKMELKGTGAASCIRLPRSKPPPRQRKGLKMRYRPSSLIGLSCTIGSSDSEEDEPEAQPNGVNHTEMAKKSVEGRKDKPSEFKKPEKPQKVKTEKDKHQKDKSEKEGPPKEKPEKRKREVNSETPENPKKKAKQEDKTKTATDHTAEAPAAPAKKLKEKVIGDEAPKKRKKKDKETSKPAD